LILCGVFDTFIIHVDGTDFDQRRKHAA
jgi:hypothetical protein